MRLHWPADRNAHLDLLKREVKKFYDVYNLFVFLISPARGDRTCLLATTPLTGNELMVRVRGGAVLEPLSTQLKVNDSISTCGGQIHVDEVLQFDIVLRE